MHVNVKTRSHTLIGCLAMFKPSITRCCAERGTLTSCLVAVAVYVSAAVATGTSTTPYTTTTTLSTTTASTSSTTDNGM